MRQWRIESHHIPTIFNIPIYHIYHISHNIPIIFHKSSQSSQMFDGLNIVESCWIPFWHSPQPRRRRHLRALMASMASQSPWVTRWVSSTSGREMPGMVKKWMNSWDVLLFVTELLTNDSSFFLMFFWGLLLRTLSLSLYLYVMNNIGTTKVVEAGGA